VRVSQRAFRAALQAAHAADVRVAILTYSDVETRYALELALNKVTLHAPPPSAGVRAGGDSGRRIVDSSEGEASQ